MDVARATLTVPDSIEQDEELRPLDAWERYRALTDAMDDDSEA